MQRPWLHIIGVGEDGIDGLSATAKHIIQNAAYVIGGKRHLAHTSSLIKGQAVPWKSPFSEGVQQVLSLRGENVVVLASGDPFDFGVGSVLAQHLRPEEYFCIAAVSSISMACGRLGWARQNISVVSLCGRPLETLAPVLKRYGKLLVLSADGTTPQKVAHYLVERGFGGSTLYILEGLGGKQEQKKTYIAHNDIPVCAALNIIGVELKADAKARIIPLSCGMQDSLFEHDGQITKREIRAITLSALAPQAGEMLWDLGAGAGSVAIEWMLRHPQNRAIAVERDAVRAQRIMRNALAFGVPGLDVVQEDILEAIDTLPLPNAVFIGGGLTGEQLFSRIRKRVERGTRLVVNAVTLQGEMILAEQYKEYGGELIRIGVERISTVGKLDAYRPAMRVTQYSTVIS
ncbi:precorrin-6y C5,15-methyltransferase (decarboxylating) subunit CbiE [Swingsia samuiensis]|uniref:Precorrin-6y C5,15-methyltransferase (Decarboxylating) subunit CbiE n=1 Tax=Swingsia samuiensis TaxID=1293412 RepID=A0A4Y6UNZ8_9PROT|nr:precorrin-6y C5,15-methyltransferase (decarboxylating) subunit CbiE [Swingsia samuiensis]